MSFKGRYLLTLLLSICCMLGKGQSLSGTVVDKHTGEAIVGAMVTLEDRHLASTGLDGSFLFKKLPDGAYTISISCIGFSTWQQSVFVRNGTPQVLQIALDSDDRSVEAVTVQGQGGLGTEQAARQRELNASQVLSTLSGRAIQLSPDLTVANAIQRISGVSIERSSNGDGQHAILRGMDKRYNYTLVNGVKISSPDNRYRYVPLDIFPSDLLDRLEVYKSLTPDLEGDAIGGAINMVMRDAPARRLLTVNVATGYNQLFADRPFKSIDFQNLTRQSPAERFGNDYVATAADFDHIPYIFREASPAPNLIAGFALGDRFYDNKLGIILAGSFQNTYRGSNSILFQERREQDNLAATLTSFGERTFSEQQRRMGLHAKLDYRFNANHSIQFYNAYMNFANSQVRDIISTNLLFGGYDPALGNGNLSFSTRSRLTQQTILNSTLQGKHQLAERWYMDWSLVFSNATNALPDNTIVGAVGEMRNFERNMTFATDGRRRWEHNRDQDFTVMANLSYNSSLFDHPVVWKIGGLYRGKKRDNFFNQHIMRTPNPTPIFGEDFTTFDQIDWSFGGASFASPLTYDATENIGAGYAQFDWKINKLDVVGGVRAEHTHQGYELIYVTTLPSGEQRYLDILPSINLKYRLQPYSNLRASYFRSINRPGFFEIVPYSILNEDYTERGNPDLQRAIADNYDIRYELIPSSVAQFMIGTFYKRIQNPIEYTLQADAIRGQDIFYSPGNFGTANNVGLELDIMKYFFRFGFRANYTFTHSTITTDKSQRIRDANGDFALINVSQTRPLFGQSSHIANLALLFKDTPRGWDAQLTGNYTGKRIATVAQFIDADYWQDGFVQLDAALDKRIYRKAVVFLKAQNLLNTPMKIYQEGAPTNTNIPQQPGGERTLIQRDFYQRTLLLGLRVDL